MTNYEVAKDCGQTGHAVNNLQVELTLGLKKGYRGFVQEKIEVLFFLTSLYASQMNAGKNYVPFVVQDSVITYAYPGDGDEIVAKHEPALVLKSDKSPLYAADTSDEEWKELVEWFAAQLGSKFEQFRVYVSFTRAEVKILQKLNDE